MALRLSGILMGEQPILSFEFNLTSVPIVPVTLKVLSPSFSGGVVIVYERKVKLLYGKL